MSPKDSKLSPAAELSIRAFPTTFNFWVGSLDTIPTLPFCPTRRISPVPNSLTWVSVRPPEISLNWILLPNNGSPIIIPLSPSQICRGAWGVSVPIPTLSKDPVPVNIWVSSALLPNWVEPLS